MHCVLPGEQTPTHTPETHAWFTQATAVLQVPVPLHV